tara:strand:+ start:959 stop:1090 length:132 start_codon:yes stop_codon:yes gene_type:complete
LIRIGRTKNIIVEFQVVKKLPELLNGKNSKKTIKKKGKDSNFK